MYPTFSDLSKRVPHNIVKPRGGCTGSKTITWATTAATDISSNVNEFNDAGVDDETTIMPVVNFNNDSSDPHPASSFIVIRALDEISIKNSSSGSSANSSHHSSTIAAIMDMVVKAKYSNQEAIRCALEKGSTAKKAYGIFQFNMCPKSCSMFEDDSCLTRCPKCNSARFNHCTKPSCENKNYDACICFGFKDRVPKKPFQYQSIIVLIETLLSSDRFVEMINFESVASKDHKKHDLLEFSEPCKQLQRMDDQFENYILSNNLLERSWNKNDGGSNSIIKVNLLASECYDGVQLSKWKPLDFWPLFISFLNVPPALRNVIGLSMFMIMTTVMSSNTAAWDYAFGELFVAELQFLEDGWDVVVNGNRYYVQVCLAFHNWDTKALEKMLFCQPVGNSAQGCIKCNWGVGLYMEQFSKCCYLGYRRRLALMHELRFFGGHCLKPTQAGVGCDLEFYNNNYKNSKYGDMKTKLTISMAQELSRSGKKVELEELAAIENTNLDSILPLRLVPQQGETRIWHHEQYGVSIWDIASAMFFPHCDFYEVPYRTITDDQYVAYGSTAQRMQQQKKTLKQKAVNGYKDVWVFNKLKYSNSETQTMYGPLHMAMGITEALVALLAGTESAVSATRLKSADIWFKNGMHPSSWPILSKQHKKELQIASSHAAANSTTTEISSSTVTTAPRKRKLKPVATAASSDDEFRRTERYSKPAWVLRSTCKTKIDTFLECILYPSGIDNSRKPTNVSIIITN
jgi:hypothetical protein